MKPSIDIERAYDLPARGSRATDLRFLVDRLWPRGIRKEELPVDGWLKDVAPSTALRRWFGHDPARWSLFRERYERELSAHPEAWQPVLDAAKKRPVTLVYGAKDPEHNHALVLRDFLRRRFRRRAQ
jgi:uncharacterized protein YeaO (DUF488 family)